MKRGNPRQRIRFIDTIRQGVEGKVLKSAEQLWIVIFSEVLGNYILIYRGAQSLDSVGSGMVLCRLIQMAAEAIQVRMQLPQIPL
jgi:hypothetical protein